MMLLGLGFLFGGLFLYSVIGAVIAGLFTRAGYTGDHGSDFFEPCLCGAFWSLLVLVPFVWLVNKIHNLIATRRVKVPRAEARMVK